MSNIAFQTGLSALLSSRFILDTIGHNIANANSRGYSRQIVQLGASLPVARMGLQLGTGVDASNVQRQIDELLGRRILSQVSSAGGLSARLGSMGEIETLLNEPADSSLGGLVDAFFSSLSELSSAPEDSILRTGAVQAALSMTGQLNTLSSGIGRIVSDVEAEIATKVDGVNQLAAEVAELNVRIAETLAAGLSPNDLADQRDRALTDLAALADVTTIPAANGAVSVLVAGNILVGATRAHRMTVARTSDDGIALQVAGANGFVPVQGGAIGGLFDTYESFGPDLARRMDEFAHNLILEVNRVHSTGVPARGPFESLTAENPIVDRDGDGQLGDELLSRAGLPFDVSSGTLWVNVSDQATGAVTKHAIEISATHTTVQDLLDGLNAIDGLSAELDGSGRLRLVAGAGRGFDFSARLDADPDAAGTFGSGRASLASAAPGPFALADGDTLDLTVDPSGAAVALSIAFDAADFHEISEASAEEIAALINADAGAQSAGIVASVAGGALVLQSAGSGASESFRLDGGSALGALGWAGLTGATVQGHANSVEPRVGGRYTGATSGELTFRPNMDGTIGTTPGLAIEVFDAQGQQVATLDVGPGYVPGSELAVGDGVTVAFGLGDVSATHNDLFTLDLVADSDTSDVLVGLGLNALLTGSSAADVGVRADIEVDPGLLASSATGSPGDGSLLLELLDVEERDVAGLGGATFGEYYGNLVGEVGFGIGATHSALQTSAALLASLEARRDQVSGVSIDEEVASMMQYEQAFAAAAQYITVVNQLDEELLTLI